ncbi:MAG: hypothetical protein RIR26_1177 [Pseudomonadota bacterium]|jgi:uncharacterized protein
MNWRLPLNQIGSGCSFSFGGPKAKARFKETSLHLGQHHWLESILNELDCLTPESENLFSMLLEVEKQSDAYRVRAQVQMCAKMECVRSLTPFRTNITSESEALYVRAAEQQSHGEHELSESEMECYEHDGAALNLSDFVTDLIYTSLPDFPLCQEECRGLCSSCGCNLNETKSCCRSESSAEECPNAHYFQ